MNAEAQETQPATGFLGRGPWFWTGMTAASTGVFVALALTGAIENQGTLLLLMIVPAITMMALVASAVNRPSNDTCIATGQAQRRYIKRVVIFTSLYLATFALLTFLDKEMTLPYMVKLALATLPGLALSGVFWAIGRLIVEEQDEFMRMLVIRQSLIASGLALSAASVWGYLEAAKVAPHIDAYWFAILWFFGLGVGAVFNRVHYGTWGAV